MPFPFIALGTAIAGGVINYIGQQEQNKNLQAEMRRRREGLEEAKFTPEEIAGGKARIGRQYGTAIDTASNKFAFTSRGVQSPAAKGAMVGEMQGAMVSDVNRFMSSTEQFNKQIDREIALTGAPPQGSKLLAAGAGTLGGLQVGLQLERYADESGLFAGDPEDDVETLVESDVSEDEEIASDFDLGSFGLDQIIENYYDRDATDRTVADADIVEYLDEKGEVVAGGGGKNPLAVDTFSPANLDDTDMFPESVGFSGGGGVENPYTFNEPERASSLPGGDFISQFFKFGNENQAGVAPSLDMNQPGDTGNISDVWNWAMRNFGGEPEPRVPLTKEEMINKYPTLGGKYSRFPK